MWLMSWEVERPRLRKQLRRHHGWLKSCPLTTWVGEMVRASQPGWRAVVALSCYEVCRRQGRRQRNGRNDLIFSYIGFLFALAIKPKRSSDISCLNAGDMLYSFSPFSRHSLYSLTKSTPKAGNQFIVGLHQKTQDTQRHLPGPAECCPSFVS